MGFKNTPQKFGFLTKFLHWTIFLLFVLEFFLMYRREYFPDGSPEKSLYMMLHKSFGICVLLLALLMIISRQIGTRPAMPATMSHFEILSAKAMHFVLYLVMLSQPITGIAMSFLAGYPVSFFKLFDLPNYLEKNEGLAKIFDTVHVWSSYAIIALVAMHAIAGLHHHFIRKDDVLRRML